MTTEAMRRWWRARFSDAELVELAAAIWPNDERPLDAAGEPARVLLHQHGAELLEAAWRLVERGKERDPLVSDM